MRTMLPSGGPAPHPLRARGCLIHQYVSRIRAAPGIKQELSKSDWGVMGGVHWMDGWMDSIQC